MVQRVSAIRNSLGSIRRSLKRRDIESQLLHHDPKSRGHSIWWTLGIDIPLFAIVAALVLLQEMGMFPQRKSGFFCNDPALSYPYKGDTISMGVIISTIVACPLVVIFLTELAFHGPGQSIRDRLCCSAVETMLLFRGYAYGLFINLTIVEVMKAVTGFPRPTFFDICEPDAALTCNGSEFVSAFECTSQRFSAWYQMDSYHSFPSGHTSLSVYCGFFIAWYLQTRAFDWQHRTVLLVPVLQLACVGYAAVCSLSRLTDHRHHWWDVLTGTAVGVLCLLYTVLALCDSFSPEKRSRTHATDETNLPSTRTSIYEDRIQAPVT
ncbi:unnamed protein product, partial [Iphiclides podalirius]